MQKEQQDRKGLEKTHDAEVAALRRDAHSDEADHAFQSDADHLRSEATQSSLSVEH